MADRKISDLTALTATASGDYLPIVDISEAAAASKNKRVTIQSLFQGIPVNVGIGTASPNRLLTLYDAGTLTYLQLAHSGASGTSRGLELVLNSTEASIINREAGGLFLSTAGGPITFGSAGERARIDSSGNVGIGTTSPSHQFDVVSAATSVAEFNGPANATVEFKGSGFAEGKIQCGGEFIIGSTNNYPVAFVANGTERARIDSSGRLLVGTSSARGNFFAGGASALTQIEGNSTGTASLSITRNDATADGNALILAKARSTSYAVLQYVDGTTSDDRIGRISFQGADGTNMVPAASIEAFVDGTPGTNDMPGRLVFSTTADGASSPTERMRITNGGNVLFNATAVVEQGLVLISYNGGVNQGAIFAESDTTSGNTAIRFKVAGSTVGSITTTSSATAYNTSSDYRLKENVTAVTDGITRLQQLKPSRFNFIADPDQTVDGFIAHEVQDIVPEAITGEKDAEDDDGNFVYQGIDQSKLVPLLTAALQEAIAKIETLEARLTAAGID